MLVFFTSYQIKSYDMIVLDVDPAIDSLRNEKKIKQQLENPQTPSNKKTVPENYLAVCSFLPRGRNPEVVYSEV